MSLDNLVEKYRKKNVKLLPPVSDPDRADKVFDWSVNHDISTDEADAEILIQEMDTYQKGLAESQAFLEIDGLVDAFDPSEPPKEGAVADPLGELLRAELDIGRESLKMYMKVMSYIYAPIDRSWKFATNAIMYEPLLKSTTDMVKRQALFVARDMEIQRRTRDLKQKGELTDEKLTLIEKEVNDQATEAIKQFNDEETPNVGIADFMKSSKDALKALIPWPGVADDVKTMAEINTESFERIVGREAPWWYTPLGDIALQTTAMIGLGKIANSLPKGKSLKGVKLTKAEVRAIKRLHKNASQVKTLPVSSNVPTRTQALTVQQKLIALVKSAKSQRPAKELTIHRDRVKKASKLAKVQKNVEGERLVSATKGALAGKAKVPDFEPINLQFSSQEIDTLFNMVNTFDFGAQPFTKGNAILALDELLKGTLINKSQQAGLEQVFGKGLTKALFGKQSITSIIQDVSFEIINTPRALLASADISAAGRQGIIFSVSHPIASTKAFGRSVRAAFDPKYADDIERVTRANKWGKLADSFGVHSSPTGFAAKIASKEEPYMSRIAETIPLGPGKVVAASERAFTTFLNQQRREVFALQARKWMRKGITPFGPRRIKRDFGNLIKEGQKLTRDQKTYQQWAKFVNHATGRGSLENLQPGALTAMNAVFFSPRFQVSRVQVIGDLINPATTRHARKAIARDLAEFYATGMGIMGLSKAGGAEVELDWKSSDFGKIKVGNTRYNYWGSFQPMARLAGQMFAGEVKSTGTGKLKDAKRIGLILSFLRSKLAPVPGRLVDVAAGETFRGEPVEFTGEFVGKAAFESLVPLFIQDSVDAWRFQGMNAQFPLSATMAFTGIGVQTWELAPHAEVILAKDSLARSTYGKNYDELNFVEVQMLDAEILVEHPGIVELERQAKFESEGVNFLTKQLKEQRRSERFLEKRLNRTFLKSLEQAKVRVGGVDRIFGNWRLNDEQYKEYQEKVAVEMNELFFEMKPLLDTLTDDDPQRYEILAKILRSSKLIAAKEMKIGDID